MFQVKIKLPETDVKDVDLDVTETFLDCRTKRQYVVIMKSCTMTRVKMFTCSQQSIRTSLAPQGSR